MDSNSDQSWFWFRHSAAGFGLEKYRIERHSLKIARFCVGVDGAIPVLLISLSIDQIKFDLHEHSSKGLSNSLWFRE